jgi:hypothetical protein
VSDFYGSLYDPWIGDEQQSHRRKAKCEIWVDERNVTAKFDPYLISVRVMDGKTTPMCEIELDDRDARLDIPHQRSKIWVFLGWVNESTTKIFEGWVTQVECGFGRKQGGRRMWVYAAGGKFVTSTITTPMSNSMGNGADPGKEVGPPRPLGNWLQEVARSNNMTAKVHPQLAKITRDYWQQSGESLIHIGERLARQFGATFRIVGNSVEFSMPGDDVDGKHRGTIDGIWGKNLIAYRVHPWVARSTWGGASQHYYSTLMGTWKKLAAKFGLNMPWSEAMNKFAPPAPAPNSQEADQQNSGVRQGMFTGQGRIVINGEPAAVFQGHIMVRGARPGVDGLWRITMAEHRYSRQGYVTWLDVLADHAVPYTAGSIGDYYRLTWTPELQRLTETDTPPI